MKSRLSILFAALAVLLSDAMCAVVAYCYCYMRIGARFMACSAPPEVAFLFAIPFIIAIAICVALAVVFKNNKNKKPHAF